VSPKILLISPFVKGGLRGIRDTGDLIIHKSTSRGAGSLLPGVWGCPPDSFKSPKVWGTNRGFGQSTVTPPTNGSVPNVMHNS